MPHMTMGNLSPREETLLQELARMAQQASTDQPLTLNPLLAGDGGRRLFRVVILLSLPFITPIPLPGMSIVLLLR